MTAICRQRKILRWHAEKGASLWFVLLITGLLAASSTVTVEVLLLSSRAARGAIRQAQLFHFAEIAMAQCERQLMRLHVSAKPEPESKPKDEQKTEPVFIDIKRSTELTGWRDARRFAAGQPGVALFNFSLVKENVAALCLMEPWNKQAEPVNAYLLTVKVLPSHGNAAGRREHGREPSNGSWLQLWLTMSGNQVRREWRSVAEPP